MYEDSDLPILLITLLMKTCIIFLLTLWQLFLLFASLLISVFFITFPPWPTAWHALPGVRGEKLGATSWVIVARGFSISTSFTAYSDPARPCWQPSYIGQPSLSLSLSFLFSFFTHTIHASGLVEGSKAVFLHINDVHDLLAVALLSVTFLSFQVNRDRK